MNKIDSLDKINALVSDIRSLRKGYLSTFTTQIVVGDAKIVNLKDMFLACPHRCKLHTVHRRLYVVRQNMFNGLNPRR